MKQEYIETPYGRKTPELLCKAMDSLVVHDDLVAALEKIASEPCDHGPQPFCPRELARAALAKAKG